MGKKKPKKSAKLVDFLITPEDGEGGENATPTIDTPLTNSFAPPDTDLTVNLSTNRGDLNYKVVFTDLNPPPAAVTADVLAPGGQFTVIIPAEHLVADRMYQIRVFVNPADGTTPPHLDHTITVHTQQMNLTVVTMGA